MWKIFFIGTFFIGLQAHAQIITTVAGGITGHGGYWGDGGPATAAAIGYTGGIAVDAHGNLFIADGDNQRLREVYAATGIINTIAGTGTAGYNGDGILATTAQLSGPAWVCVDTFGNIYIEDGGNYRIRKIDAATGIISTVVGNGSMGFSGDGLAATSAEINGVQDITMDNFGNLYFNDGSNFRVRKVDALGIITTVAGTGVSTNTGDGGPATSATVSGLLGICTDALGNIYITDSSASIRKINVSTGIITRVAGMGNDTALPYLGDGLFATSSHIGADGVAVDDTGNIYIADYSNSRIEKVDTFGIIYTIVGTGIAAYCCDGGAATAAEINLPENVVLDQCNNVYISDYGNRRVREVTYPYNVIPPTVTGPSSAMVGSVVTVNATVGGGGSGYTIHWYNNSVLFNTTTVPMVTYTKGTGTDNITATVLPASTLCYDSSTSVVLTITALPESVNHVAVLPIHIYPNPVGDVVNVDGDVVGYTIYSIVGATLLQGKLVNGSNNISMKSFTAGLYLLEVTDGEGGKVVSKIVKE